MKITSQFIADVKAWAGPHIADIVREHVELKKFGQNLKGCCPFHGEKTPSFSVNVTKQTCHCFGCGKGGDAIWFTREINHADFKSAITILAKMGGIPLPDGRETEEERTKKALFRLNERANRHFLEALGQNFSGSKDYVDGRMTADMVESSGVGFAQIGNTLLEVLIREGANLDLAFKAGLLGKNHRGDLYDYFRGRVMFPFRDTVGRIIGFAGRTFNNDKGPKYVNSAETPLFQKRFVLFGVDRAVKRIKETGEAFVVEGYTDLNRMHAAGVMNTVATCGTAFTKDHSAMLAKYGVKTINFVFDGDGPGRKATEKAILLAIKEDMSSKAYLLPDGEDPDTFLKSGKMEDIPFVSGLQYLETSGAEMSSTMKNLLRLEKLEKGILYMAEKIPEVRAILQKRGNLHQLFDPATAAKINLLLN